MTVSLLFVVVHGLLVPSQILETLRSVVTAAAWFFITSTAIFYLHKSLAISSAAFYLCIALLMPLGALFAVGRGDLFGLLSYSLAALFCWTMSCCWWTLANLQESNRFLLRAPYKMILSKPALAVAADIQFHARKNKKMCGLCYDVSRFPFVRCGIFIGDKLSDYFLRRARNENWILCPSAQSFARCCRPNHRRRC